MNDTVEAIARFGPADALGWKGDSWCSRTPRTGVVRELLECGQAVKRIRRFPLRRRCPRYTASLAFGLPSSPRYHTILRLPGKTEFEFLRCPF